jgi:X-Pro dipeptidyl-peptidase (S15 family)
MTREHRRALVLWANVALSVVITTGCCHVPLSSKHRPAQPLPASLAVAYACPKEEKRPVKREALKAESKYSIHRIELPAAGVVSDTNRNIVFDYYTPAGLEKFPIILVLPIFGGSSYPIEHHFASYFAQRGLGAVIVHREKWRSDSVTAEEIDTMLRQTVLDNKRVLDWLEDQKELDPGKVGVFGASMGAIKGALLTPLENRVQAAVLGLVAGDIPYVVTYSTEKGVARQRKAYLERHSISLEELQEQLRARITCDPEKLAPFVDPKKVLLVLASCDTVVPINKGLALRKKMGKPETLFLPTGHYSAVLCLPYIKSQSVRFFRKRFAEVEAIACARP